MGPRHEPQHGDGGRPKRADVLARHPHLRRDLELARGIGLTAAQWYALSDEERDYWIADWELERLKCPQCGGNRKECGDPQKAWYPQRTVCYAAMAAASVNARYDEKHHGAPYHDGTFKSWAPKRTPSHPFESREGVTLWVSAEDLTPDDDFLRGPSAQSVEGERNPEHP